MKRKEANLSAVFIFLWLVFGVNEGWASQAVVIESIGGGEINWSQGIVTAKGSGAPPKESKNIAQARLMTERAALADARRTLLEVLKGVRVDSVTYVEMFILKNDEIRLRAEGLIQASTEIRKLRRYLSDGAIEVTVAMSLGGGFLDPADEPAATLSCYPNSTPSPFRAGETPSFALRFLSGEEGRSSSLRRASDSRRRKASFETMGPQT